MNIFEALMLVCFGLSWPISIAKMLRTKNVEGKSPMFVGVVGAGYVFGIIFKLDNLDWVIFLYIANLLLIAADLILYYRYARKGARAR